MTFASFGNARHCIEDLSLKFLNLIQIPAFLAHSFKQNENLAFRLALTNLHTI
jgi:hypothetical protein